MSHNRKQFQIFEMDIDYSRKRSAIRRARWHWRQELADGWTYGSKQQLTDTPTGQSRKNHAASHPTGGLYNEVSEVLAAYWGQGGLTNEVVGSYLYLYRLCGKGGHVAGSDYLDAQIEAYLAVVAQKMRQLS